MPLAAAVCVRRECEGSRTRRRRRKRPWVLVVKMKEVKFIIFCITIIIIIPIMSNTIVFYSFIFHEFIVTLIYFAFGLFTLPTH